MFSLRCKGILMQIALIRNIFAVVALSATLAACAPKSDTAGSGTSSAVQPGQLSKPVSETKDSSILPETNPPHPGNFETRLVDGVEMRVGRSKPGLAGGTLVKVIAGVDPKVFNPWTASDTLSRELATFMFRGLVDMDYYTGEVIPDMAAEVKELPDKLTYIVRLRKGLRWSDGHPITSADVVFTWNKIIAQGYGNSSLRDVTTIDGKSPTVTALDDLTIKFVTPKPFVPFKRLLGINIAPKHVVEPIISAADGRKAFDRLWASDCKPSSLVTSGPFVLSRFLPAQRVEMVKTDNFYMIDKAGKKLPYLDKIVYQIVPDVNTLLIKFNAKEIDITQLRPRDVVSLLEMQKSHNFTLFNLGPSIGSNFIMFNLNRRTNPKTKKPYVDSIKSAWFNDLNFRQAVNHALNRSRMVQNYFKGIGFEEFVSESKSSPFYNKNLAPFEQDLELAKSYLTKSGFQLKDKKLYDSKGNRVEFDMVYGSGGTFYDAISEMIRTDLEQLGIKVNSQAVNFNVLIDKINTSMDWQCVIFSLVGDPTDPNDAGNVYKSDGRLHCFDQRLPDKDGTVIVTDARPWEKRLDEIFNSSASEFDRAKRGQLMDEYQKIIYDQAPFIYLVNAKFILGARNTIKNLEPTQLSQLVGGLHNIEEIYKEPDKESSR